MNEQKPIIVPEEIECSSGSVFSFNYKRVVYSLTMQPDKILIQQAISKSKTPAKGTSQIIMLNSLEEYQTWYSKLKLSYGKRITRRRLHYATTENGIIKYTDYPWSAILHNSLGDEKDRDLEEDITIITTNGGQEVNLILNTDDLILNAYPKEETEEEPFISFTLENIKYKLYID